MEAAIFLIEHPSELNALTAPRPFRKRGRGRIRLSPELDHPERETWEAAINRYYHACGCSSGAKGLLLMLVLGVAAAASAYGFDLLSVPQTIAIPLASAVAGAVFGKLAGLATARRRLIRVVHTVQANWKPRDPQERPSITCG
jgi:hypothetical protein